jgi:hypothetical protein
MFRKEKERIAMSSTTSEIRLQLFPLLITHFRVARRRVAMAKIPAENDDTYIRHENGLDCK